MKQTSVYLSSLESVRFEPVRKCQYVESLEFDTAKTGVLVRLEPGVSGQDFGISGEITDFILTTRFEGATISPIDKFPCFVFIALPRKKYSAVQLRASDLRIVGWGELYRTLDDAENHTFELE